MLEQKSDWQKTKVLNPVALPPKIQTWPKAVQKTLELSMQDQDATDLKTFLKCNIEHDAKNLNQIDAAWARIDQAKQTQEPVVVYGDYDVDGMTSATIMYTGLKAYGLNVSWYVPDRDMGYGPQQASYRDLFKAGTKLIVTVDNGVSGKDVIDKVVKHGIDVIVTDHHEPDTTKIPQKAIALVHPMLSPNYPFNGLSGAGVAYKFITYKMPELIDRLMPFAAMGIVADVMPLIDENRRIVKKGLQKLATTKLPGLIALKRVAKVEDQDITASSIGFNIGPILNSIGRMADAKAGVDLLLADNMEIANDLADAAESLNFQRKNKVAELSQQAAEQVKNQKQDHGVLIVGGKGIHYTAGLVGLVANQVVSQFNKPVLALAYDPKSDTYHGSARTVNGYNIFKALIYVDNVDEQKFFNTMGGHAGAAGFDFDADELAELQRRLDAYVEMNPLPTKLGTLKIVTSVKMEQITPDFYDQLQWAAPFGKDNPEPLFHVHLNRVDKVMMLGQSGQHVKVLGTDNHGHTIDCLGFFMGEDFDKLKQIETDRSSLDVVGIVKMNYFRGDVKAQMFVSDWSNRPVILNADE